jgi:tRNA A37 threonylcarbamoyladenosine synthetase subunit TsaC/SUA5/YrdC
MSVILTQTDTTVGFLSQDALKLYEIKSRNTTKPFIKVFFLLQVISGMWK